MATKCLDLDYVKLPSENDIKFYREHGWYVTPKVLSDEVLDAALVGCERYYTDDLDHRIPPEGKHFDWTPEQGDRLRTNAYVSLQVKEIRQLVEQSVIGAIAGRLVGTKKIRMFRDQLIFKPSVSIGVDTLVGWHRDRTYWLTCTSERMLTAWIPLTGVSENNGTLTVIDGSHKWRDKSFIRGFTSQDTKALEDQFSKPSEPFVKVALELRRGQISFHHCKTIHGSMVNHSKRPRIALSIHLQDDENRYRAWHNAKGERLLHLNDLLCRKNSQGDPDYSDPVICPQLWSE